MLSKEIYFLSLVGVILSPSLASKPQDDYQAKEQIIKDFFALSHIAIDEDFADLKLDKYSDATIKLMEEAFIEKDNADSDDRIQQVNKLIYIDAKKGESSANYDPDDGHLFDAIDMMLPDCLRYPQFEAAKTDLRNFYIYNKTRAKLLLKHILDRLNADSKDGDVILTTTELVDVLVSYRDRWLPLYYLDGLMAHPSS